MHLRGLVAEAEGVLGLVEERTLSSMLGREMCDASKDTHGVLVRVARKGVTGLLARRLLAVGLERRRDGVGGTLDGVTRLLGGGLLGVGLGTIASKLVAHDQQRTRCAPSRQRKPCHRETGGRRRT